uniref:NADH-ubiquinone oxidoreductase chain 6 n=1 Tax=Somena scintillans TaxID=1706520 RepID=A0A385NH78_9NEOP|nr:NADH dehydrogenase subunit 6 [Somena scintillans]AYA73190.1 NADH dehydrogenase subunit 6 [Somena scintillans]
MKMMLMFLSIIMSIFMTFLNSPLPMGLLILMQTMITCLISGMIMKTYWFSYILFLIFLGGLLVLFIYVSSISPNELFNLNFFFLKMFYFIIIIGIFMFIFYLINNLVMMNLSINSDMENIFTLKNLIQTNSINKFNLNKLYNNHTFIIMFMMMIYLLITLIIVVKIINIFYGPLRSNF